LKEINSVLVYPLKIFFDGAFKLQQDLPLDRLSADFTAVLKAGSKSEHSNLFVLQNHVIRLHGLFFLKTVLIY
jgi:hypothetical protein